MKAYIKKHFITISLAVAGAAGGFIYWKYVGCLSGTCIIKSVWYLSTLYGLGLGWLTGNLLEELIINFKKRKEYE
jgi:hypothetical protein